MQIYLHQNFFRKVTTNDLKLILNVTFCQIAALVKALLLSKSAVLSLEKKINK